MTVRQERIGLVFAALCALNGAFVPAFAKLTTNRADPLFVAAATSLFGAAFGAIVLGARRELHFLVRRKIGLRLAAIGALGTAAAYLLFFSGARRTTAIETVVCLQIEPAYAMLAAWLGLGHQPTLRRLIAIGTLLVGIILAVGGATFSPSSGAWLLLATPICWQASHLVVLRGLVGVPPAVLTGARYIHGGLLLALYWVASGGIAVLPASAELLRLMPLLALQGVILFYVGTLLWYQAVTRLDLARTTAIVVPSIPVLSLGASFVLLGEVPSVHQCIGLLLTAAGVLTFVTAPHASAAPSGSAAARDLRPSAEPS